MNWRFSSLVSLRIFLETLDIMTRESQTDINRTWLWILILKYLSLEEITGAYNVAMCIQVIVITVQNYDYLPLNRVV